MAETTDKFIVDDPERGIFKVHRSTMTSSDVLQEERAAIFDRCWLYLGHESEVAEPGDFVTRTLARRPLIFSRGEDGVVRALINSCTHRGALVCREACGTAKRHTCFYHGWTFANDGELLTLPDEDAYAESFDKSRMGLAQVPRLDEYRGFWFVCFDPGVIGLEEYLADAKEYLDIVADHGPDGMEVVGGTQDYSIRANWKLLVENSVDGYHALTTHATYLVYLKDLGTDLSPGFDGVGRDLKNGHACVEYVAPWGRPVARWEPRWGDEAKVDIDSLRAELDERVGPERGERIASRDRNLQIFPNLIINDIMAITIRTFDAVDVDYMNVSAWALAPKGEPDHLRARRLDSFLTFLGPGGLATPDDIEALEACQAGFGAVAELPWSDISRGYGREVPKTVDELQMQSFWRRWNELVTGPAGSSVIASIDSARAAS